MKPEDYKDGENCINIYSKGLTPLGRSLSNFADCDITTSIGHFRTIEGLIFFLGSFDDSLRNMDGISAKRTGPKLNRGITLPEDIFKKLIIEAMEEKVRDDGGLRFALKASELPLVHYYNIHGKKTFLPKWDWQVSEWERIRSEIKAGTFKLKEYYW